MKVTGIQSWVQWRRRFWFENHESIIKSRKQNLDLNKCTTIHPFHGHVVMWQWHQRVQINTNWVGIKFDDIQKDITVYRCLFGWQAGSENKVWEYKIQKCPLAKFHQSSPLLVSILPLQILFCTGDSRAFFRGRMKYVAKLFWDCT